MRITESKVRHASEIVLISAVVYFAKKKRIIRYLPSLHDYDTNFLWFVSTFVYPVKRYKQIEKAYGTCEDFDQYRSLQPSFEREWLYLKESAEAFSMIGFLILILSINEAPEYRSLWVVALLSYQMGAIILFNLSLSSLLILRRMWATEDAFQKVPHFQPATNENDPIFPQSNLPNLPREVEQIILSYVDAKTLMRGRSVNKLWHAAITHQLEDRASQLDLYVEMGLSNWTFIRFPRCPSSPQGVVFLSEASTFRHLTTLPIERPQNRAFTPKMLYLPPHTNIPTNSLELSILTLNKTEYLFYSGMRIPLVDLFDPFKQWRFRHDSNSNPYRHPYPLAIDYNHQAFYFIKDGMLHSARLDHPLEEKFYVNFKKSIQKNPAIDRNGILYFSSTAKENKATLYAIHPQNPSSPLWSYTLNYPHVTTPTIDKNGIIYVGCSLYQEYNIHSPTYTQEANLFAFDPKTIDQENPQPCWSYRSGCIIAPLTISSDQELYVGTPFGAFYVFDLKNLEKLSPSPTQVFFGERDFATSLPAIVDAKKRAFVAANNCLNLDISNRRWRFFPTKLLHNEKFFPPLLDVHGRVFLTTSHGRVFGIQPDAIPRNPKVLFDCSDPAVFYKFDPSDHGLKGLFIQKYPTMDSHGRIFMVSSKGFLLCLEPTLS